MARLIGGLRDGTEVGDDLIGKCAKAPGRIEDRVARRYSDGVWRWSYPIEVYERQPDGNYRYSHTEPA
jgi:hypothetical protein